MLLWGNGAKSFPNVFQRSLLRINSACGVIGCPRSTSSDHRKGGGDHGNGGKGGGGQVGGRSVFVNGAQVGGGH